MCTGQKYLFLLFGALSPGVVGSNFLKALTHFQQFSDFHRHPELSCSKSTDSHSVCILNVNRVLRGLPRGRGEQGKSAKTALLLTKCCPHGKNSQKREEEWFSSHVPLSHGFHVDVSGNV